MHEVLVYRLGGLSLLRKSVVRLTDHPDMTLDVYCGRKTTKQQLYIYVIVIGTPLCFSIIYTKGSKFHDFLFASQGNKTSPKRVHS